MGPRTGPARTGFRLCLGVLALAAVLLTPERSRAQETGDAPPILALEATPIGGLPPMPLPMPASRNHHYLNIRLQAGERRGRGGSDLFSIGGGIDLQWRGGSVFGVTAGYQARECDPADQTCGGHLMLGTRARLNFITGGPTLAALIGDHTATTTLGAEIGLGYAPDMGPELNACTAHLGAPVSLAMLKRPRVAAFLTPTLGLEVDCSPGDQTTRLSFLTSAGIGVQQLLHRGLDVYVGVQRIFREHTGYQIGISAVYVHLP